MYDGTDWRLPAFNDTSLKDVKGDGIVDDLAYSHRGVKADFKVLGLGGAALPGLPNLAAVVANGPKLSFDTRTGGLKTSGSSGNS